MDFYERQFATEEFPVCLAVDESTEIGDELRNDLGMIVELEREDSAVANCCISRGYPHSF